MSLDEKKSLEHNEKYFSRWKTLIELKVLLEIQNQQAASIINSFEEAQTPRFGKDSLLP